MIEIRQTPMGGDVRDFLNVVDYIYKDEPNFIRPLDQDLKDRLNPKKNPLFEHADGTIFTAYRNGARKLLFEAERQRFLAEEWPAISATIQRLGLTPGDLLAAGRSKEQ